MSSYAGIIRTEAGLADLLRLLRARRDMIEEYYWRHTVTRDLLELRNIALIAELIAEGALQRRESRGGHCREDHPERAPRAVDTVLGRQRAAPPSAGRAGRGRP
jgi:L-aspartate oxidase